MLDRARPNPVEVDQVTGPNDEGLKAQAIQDSVQTRNLIAIETARDERRLRLVVVIGTFAFLGLALLVGAALFVVQAAGHLRLPWSRIGTAVLTFVATAITTGATVWAKRALAGRRANAGNRPGSRTEDDQDPVRAP
jgi:hypothetical protein